MAGISAKAKEAGRKIRQLGERGVLTDQDIKRMQQSFPRRSDRGFFHSQKSIAGNGSNPTKSRIVKNMAQPTTGMRAIVENIGKNPSGVKTVVNAPK